MRLWIPLLAVLAFGAPTVAPAFNAPTGCDGVVTIQHRSCRVLHLWRCPADPEGMQHLGLFGPDGIIRFRTVDPEYQWLRTVYPKSGRTEWMAPSPTDEASVSELLDAGIDTYDFEIENSDNITIRVTGTDRLSGTSLTLNGFQLLGTRYTSEYFSATGQSLGQSSGDQFIIPELRIFVWGVFYDSPNPGETQDFSPVEILRPGEAGFFADQPKYDCGDLLSRSGLGHSDDLQPIKTGYSE